MLITFIHPLLPSTHKTEGFRCVAALVCKDGFTFSVQASASHYCTPREDAGPHTHFEVGYPSAVEPALLPYAEDDTKPTETVYAWVPADIIDDIILKHGGFA